MADSKLIIGDNRQILKSSLLQEYKERIKMVYIDPPYNTQTEKSYSDKADSDIWLVGIRQVLEMLHVYLCSNGIIFISIDDSEYASLKLLCDRIFGKTNFIGTFITRQAQRSNSKYINIVHEYILAYARDITKIKKFSIKRMDIPEQRDMINDICSQVEKCVRFGIDAAEKKLQSLINFYCEKYDITWLKNYCCVDNNGKVYFASDLSTPGTPRAVDIPEINLHLEPLKTRTWVSDKKFMELYKKGLLVFRNDRPYVKKYLRETTDNAPSLLNFYSRHGTNDMNKLGLRGLFDTPKPVELIKYLIRIANVGSGDYVLDCYAGSGTTGQAVIEVNMESHLNISFILIQKKEPICLNSAVYISAKEHGIDPYISEITKLRLKKVYDKYNMCSDMECLEDAV